MKKITKKEIKKELDSGKIVIINPKLYKGLYLGGSIVKRFNFYHYKHFGSSAIKTKKESLKWLLDVIFELKETDRIYSTDTLFID